MSSKAEHFRAGATLALVSAALAYCALDDSLGALLIAAGCFLGSSLPDQLEIAWHTGGRVKRGWFGPRYTEGTRHSLIPHRTITHWLVLWCAVLGWVLWKTLDEPTRLNLFALGFVMSGWVHVLMDSRTPIGVPLIHPWRRTRGS
jgi:membrane-bound metal-dependent hydrolase YbcI (DUF457 family)